ncbi:MAG: protein kinase [Gemmatimonadetes bacterium]|nr:protein kinase [Gemmatimonadota bacterium]
MTETLERLTTALADRYTIEGELGAGGMANVYLAEDLKHKRKVAVKVLRPELAAVLGAERFVQEITTTASLQHPHILPLFDSGEADGFLFYVMPFIDGETLRDKLNRETQLGIDEAVKITTEVADALDYAHRHNVIHRDIKPENILLHDGRAMVADFGIALAVSAAAGGRMTETGLSLGTPHYMSPEQATAEKDITYRSDIYSLGSVLYEMLTGEPPHTGGSVQAIIMKIVTDQARPVHELRRSVPQNVAAAVARSLEKLAADRFPSAKRFAEAMADPNFTMPSIATAKDAYGTSLWNPLSVTTTALVTLLVGMLTWIVSHRPVTSPPPVRFVLQPPDQVVFRGGPDGGLAFSADGSRFLYRGVERGVITSAGEDMRASSFFVRAVADLESHRLSAWGRSPFFSPDGQWIGFFSRATGQMHRVPAAGGPVQVIGDVATEVVHGASWGGDDVIVFGAQSGGLRLMPAAGSAARVLTEPDTSRNEIEHRWPHFLPESRAVVFTVWKGDLATASVAAVSLQSGQVTQFAELGLAPEYVDTGHLVFARSDGSVVALPFDSDRLEVTGPPIPILDHVSVPANGPPHLAVSRNGSLVFSRAGSMTGRTLVTVDRAGSETPINNAGVHQFKSPRFSPAGDKVSLTIEGRLRVWDVDQEIMTVFPADQRATHPNWTPDGERIVFTISVDSSENLFSMPADGSSGSTLFFEDPWEIWEHEISPDGRWLAYRSDTRPVVVRNMFVAAIDGSQDRRPYAQTPADEAMLTISPDGGWLAYVSNQSGRQEVYVRSFPNPGAQFRISRDGGTAPRWSRNGTELYYRALNELMAATVETSPTFRVVSRETLFNDSYLRSSVYADYDVDPRTGNFMMIKEQAQDVVVVLHFSTQVEGRSRN